MSIKMAKEQGLSLNPTKISGCCGRLMCCLKYEQDTYEELLRSTPKVGAIVTSKEGKGTVLEANLLTGAIKVRLDKSPDSPPVVLKREDVKVILGQPHQGGQGGAGSVGGAGKVVSGSPERRGPQRNGNACRNMRKRDSRLTIALSGRRCFGGCCPSLSDGREHGLFGGKSGVSDP